MWSTLYHLIIYPALLTAVRIAALWSPKARLALRGRSDWRGPVSRIRRAAPGDFRIHFHAASVGEFEQAKPLIERLRAEENRYHITASFFSPSGFEGQKSYPLIDGACYIPHDRQGEMSEFMNRLTPDLIVVVRYDLWLEFMRQAELRRIPVVLICGVLRADSIRFFPGLRRFFSSLYGHLSLIHCVGPDDAEAFRRLVPDVPVHVSGDTRYDRVAGRLKRNESIAVNGQGRSGGNDRIAPLRSIAGDRTVLVAGSTWPEDERLLVALAHRRDLFVVLVPHEPSANAVGGLVDRFPGAMPLSGLAGREEDAEIRAVVVDRIGILAGLYVLADIAYVGGGFGSGVHSLLEPAAFGVPLLSGPRIERSRDAVALRDAGLLDVVTTGEELLRQVERLLDNGEERHRIAERTRSFVQERQGATELIVASLHRERLLPEPRSTFERIDER